MADNTTAIVISVVSLAGTLIAACIGAYVTLYSDERAARREQSKILMKYRDPLLLSAQDLQARLYGISQRDVLDFMQMDEEGEEMYRDALCIYTAFVVGQYFSWCWILRRQAQFTALASTSPPRWHLWANKHHDTASALNKAMENVRNAFNSSAFNPSERPFMLFKASQTAIGEVMSCQDTNSSEYYCMGYATFVHRWKNGAPEQEVSAHDHDAEQNKAGDYMAGVAKIPDREFRQHFYEIERGIKEMWDRRQRWREQNPNLPAHEAHNQGSDGRLRRLQHLLLDLAVILDPKGLMNHKTESLRADGVPDCKCSRAPCHIVPAPRRTLTGRSLSGLQKVVSLGAERDLTANGKQA